MNDDLERQIADMLADGRMTDGDAENIRDFIDFLSIAGPPAKRNPDGTYQPSPDGKNSIQRLREAGRVDLIGYALPGVNGEVAFWETVPAGDFPPDVVGEPPYNHRRVADRIQETIDCLRVLDLGCGNGRLTNFIAQRLGTGGVIHGVDISRTLIDRAVLDAANDGPTNVHYWHGNGRTLPAGLNGRFTGAYSVSMFQHIPHDVMWGYLREVHERLEPGGTFLFTIAVGEVDEFLNHQIADTGQFADDLMQFFDMVTVDPPDSNGWTWVACEKETR